MSAQAKQLFQNITNELSKYITQEFIMTTRTEKGNTQACERIIIQKICEVLDAMALSYKQAGSQQSKDFRNVGDIDLDIEVKKTDNMKVFFNDTCPSEKIFYVIFFTGKEYKKTPEKNIPGKLLFMNGEEFVKDSPWIEDYIQEITRIKDKYGRGENKKCLEGIMEVYPRPTFKADISKFLGVENDEKEEEEEEEEEDEVIEEP
jgi:hypothetical protein